MSSSIGMMTFPTVSGKIQKSCSSHHQPDALSASSGISPIEVSTITTARRCLFFAADATAGAGAANAATRRGQVTKHI